MCLAVPARIVELDGSNATISVAGVMREVDVSLIDDPRLGEYVLIHAGFAIHKWDQSEVDQFEAIRASTDLPREMT